MRRRGTVRAQMYVWRRGGKDAGGGALCSSCKDTAATQADNDCAHTGSSVKARQCVYARSCVCLLGKVVCACVCARAREGGGRLFLATDIWKLMDEESTPHSLPSSLKLSLGSSFLPSSLPHSPLLEAFIIAPPKTPVPAEGVTIWSALRLKQNSKYFQ